MATSGALTTNNSNIKYTITITQNSRNISDNTSSVTVSVRFYRTNTGYTTYGTGTVYCKINGTTYSEAVTSDDKITSSGIVLFSKKLNIAHNTDGSKTLTTSAWITHSQVTSSEQSYSQTLESIPRATTPTLSSSSVNMGSTITISTPRASANFTHTLSYSFNGATGTMSSSVATSYTWTVPLTLANKLPNATSGSGTITCKTYNGTTLIGTKSVSFTAKVPASVVPTISTITVAETVSNIASQFNGFVQNRSKLKITTTATGAYSSTIKYYKTNLNGVNYTANPCTTGVINKSGNITLTVVVTDSRGRTATKTQTVTLIAYNEKKINSFAVERADADGTTNADGEYLKAIINYAISPVNNLNTKSYQIQYKLKTDTSYTTLATITDAYTMNGSYVSTQKFAIDKSYDIRLQVSDFFGSVNANATLATAFTLINLNASGKGIGIGKVSEQDEYIEIGLKTKFNYGETPADAIVLDSTSDLNNLLTPAYYVFSSTNSKTISNLPIGGTGSGSVQVIREGDSNQVRQVVTRCSATYREIWERLYYSNTWQEWLCIYKGGGDSRILWSGGMYMTADHKITLTEPISKQPNGIILIFSRYSNGAVADTNFNSFFVSKYFIAQKAGYGHMFAMWATPTFEMAAGKYLYINDSTITGHANNTLTGTSTTTGITYTNNAFVLRYVIGI